jgi:hypothetical protein
MTSEPVSQTTSTRSSLLKAEEQTAQDILSESRRRILKELGPQYETLTFLELVDRVLDRAWIRKTFVKDDTR